MTGVVALVVIGPKELPVMMRSAGRFVRRAKMVAGEFYQQFEDLADVAELEKIKKQTQIDADSVEPVLTDDEARRLAAGGDSSSSSPLIEKEEVHVTPDRELTLIVRREDDDVIVSFQGCSWEISGDLLVEEYALLGQSFSSEVYAARHFVQDLKQDRIPIVFQREDDRIVDAWLCLSADGPGSDLPAGQHARFWSGKAAEGEGVYISCGESTGKLVDESGAVEVTEAPGKFSGSVGIRDGE